MIYLLTVKKLTKILGLCHHTLLRVMFLTMKHTQPTQLNGPLKVPFRFMLSTCYQYNLKYRLVNFRSNPKLHLMYFMHFTIHEIIARISIGILILDIIYKILIMFVFFVLPVLLYCLAYFVIFCLNIDSFINYLNSLIGLIPVICDLNYYFFTVLTCVGDLSLSPIDLGSYSSDTKDFTGLNTILMMNDNDGSGEGGGVYRAYNPNNDHPAIIEYEKNKYKFTRHFEVRPVMRRNIFVFNVLHWGDSIVAIRDNPKYGPGIRLAAFSTTLSIDHVMQLKDVHKYN
uniref:hypothetical protein n=1 Tax=Porodaedalea mongolica TaxID=2651638 RepID=UPI0021AD2920|nr:hypothetical protein NYK79_mgp37 [Porodaedalea mongolica]UUA03953.1 hypothetical protein [Porodaedalea mongolica]